MYWDSENVSRREAVSDMVIDTIHVGILPQGIAISPDGTRAYVAHFGDGTLAVIDTTTNRVISSLFLGLTAYAVAITPDGSRVYVTS